MLGCEQRRGRAADRIAERGGHGLPAAAVRGVAATGSDSLVLGTQQDAALAHITSRNDLSIVVGYAGTGKSAMLGVARDEWERAGYTVRGAALSGLAAAGLEGGSGIASHTIPSRQTPWERGG